MKNVMTVQGPIHLYILLINFTTMSFPYPKTPPTIKESGALDWAFPQSIQFSSVQSLSGDRLFNNPRTRTTPGFPVHHQIPGLTQIQVHWIGDAIQTAQPLLPLLLLPLIFPSIRVFSNESALHIRWPKYWSFSFNISPSNEHSGLISFRMDWSWISLHSKKLSWVFSNTTVQRHQFFGAQLSL